MVCGPKSTMKSISDFQFIYTYARNVLCFSKQNVLYSVGYSLLAHESKAEVSIVVIVIVIRCHAKHITRKYSQSVLGVSVKLFNVKRFVVAVVPHNIYANKPNFREFAQRQPFELLFSWLACVDGFCIEFRRIVSVDKYGGR